MKTIGSFPRAIFFVSVATSVIGFVLLAFIRLPNLKEYRRETLADAEESDVNSSPHTQAATLIGDNDGGDGGRRSPSYGSTR